MSDKAMLGYVIHFAHNAGTKGRLVTPELVEEILAEAARHVARKEIRAYRNAEPDEPSTDEDDLKALLTIRNEGPLSKAEVADRHEWFSIRCLSAFRRLSAQGLIEVYETGYFVITDKGRDRLREAALIGGEAPKPPARDPGACRFPPSWGQELGD